jgi:UDP-perosamine 4-acetyltransferase
MAGSGVTQRVALLGGGGHAAVVIEAMRAAGQSPAFVLDRNRALAGTVIDQVPVLGDDGDLARREVTHFVVTLGAVGQGGERHRLFEIGIAAGLLPLTVVHPAAVISTSSRIGAGSVILAGAAVCARATIGRNVIINTRAVVEHDCQIGDHVHVATAACLCGGVGVGERALVGAGATVRQGIAIGPDAVVGLGSAVIDDVPPGAIVMGVPARLKP